MDTSKVSFLLDKFGGRKMLALIIVVAVAGIAVAMKGDVPSNLLALLQTLFGGFVAGNLSEHWAKNITAGKGGPPAAPVADKAVQASVKHLHERVDNLFEQGRAQQELLMTVGQSVHAVNEILSQIGGAKR